MTIKILIFFIIIILIDIYFETNYPKINLINIKSNKALPKKELKILQISDYHNFKYNEKVLKLVEKSGADVIVITGDLIDKQTKDYNNAYSLIEQLNSINSNIYYVPGNHEFKSGNMERILENIRRRDIKVLINESETLNIENGDVNICGLDYSSSKKSDLNKTLNGIDESLYTVLLSHKPDIVKRYSNINCDLILCGHTHGGQIRFPFIGAIISPDQGLLPQYNKGLYKITDKTLLYIDSGVGTTRLPIRFLNRSQISLITIRN